MCVQCKFVSKTNYRSNILYTHLLCRHTVDTQQPHFLHRLASKVFGNNIESSYEQNHLFLLKNSISIIICSFIAHAAKKSNCMNQYREPLHNTQLLFAYKKIIWTHLVSPQILNNASLLVQATGTSNLSTRSNS